jgi:hypothetical protein
MNAIELAETPANDATIYDVDGRIAYLQSERHRLLEERRKPRQNLAELDLRLDMIRAELQTLYASRRCRCEMEGHGSDGCRSGLGLAKRIF